MRKRLFALFLTACMIISILPAAVMAAAPATVKLTWNEVYGASGYQIWMDNTFMQDYEIVKTITDGSITAYTKYDLEPADYQFKIRAYVEADGRKTFADFSPVAHLLVD